VHQLNGGQLRVIIPTQRLYLGIILNSLSTREGTSCPDGKTKNNFLGVGFLFARKRRANFNEKSCLRRKDNKIYHK
jgi:hypothetical protein